MVLPVTLYEKGSNAKEPEVESGLRCEYIVHMDISAVLLEWPYDPDHNVRLIEGVDGRPLLQVRLPLGIEQYEVEGRPDGLRPGGYPTALDMVKARKEDWIREQGSDAGFALVKEEFDALHQEAVLFYYRYLHLFQIGEFERVVEDTAHNMEIFSLVESFYPHEEARELLQYWPYLLRMHAVARAMVFLKEEDHEAARTVLGEALSQLQGMEDLDSPIFFFEKLRSISYLTTVSAEIEEMEAGPAARLRAQLQSALEKENYEKAAEIRDMLRRLSQDSS